MTDKKDDIKYHELLKQAALYSYHDGKTSLPSGYKVIDVGKNDDNGFYADVLSNGKHIIIAYRGTDLKPDEAKKDIKNDVYMAQKRLPIQAIDALNLYDKTLEKYPNLDITMTGESLGGSLGAIVSGVRGGNAVTFNPYGIKNMFIEGTKFKDDNLINYINEWDPITMFNAENHIGTTYAVNSKSNQIPHFSRAMNSLADREFRTPQDLKRHKNILNRVENKMEYTTNKVKNYLHNNMQKMQDKIKNYVYPY